MQKSTWVEPILFGYMFCCFSIVSLEQQLIYKKICVQTFSTSYCNTLSNSKNSTYTADRNFLQKSTSKWEVYLSFAKTVPSVIATLLCTKLFDSFGRKRIMIMPVIGGTIKAIDLILHANFLYWPVEFMLIGTILEAMFGQFAAILACCFAYVADVSDVKSRTKRTLFLETMIFLGGIASNTTTGNLVDAYGFVSAFILVLSMYAFQLVYWMILKESYLPADEHKGKTFIGTICSRNFLTGKLFVEAFIVAFKKREKGIRKIILMLIGCFFVFIIYFVGFNSITTLYILDAPINFSSSLIGYFYAEENALKFIGASFINYVFFHKLGLPDSIALAIYCAAILGSSLSLAFTTTQNMVYVACLWNLGLGVGPGVIRGKLSKLVGVKEQGKIFSLTACIEVLSSFVAGVMFNAIYNKTVEIAPNIIYFVCAGISIIPIVLVTCLICLERPQSEYEELAEEKEHIPPINT